MKTKKLQCSDERLIQLLKNSDNESLSSEFADHVTQCIQCQTRIEELAADAQHWRFAKEGVLFADGLGISSHRLHPHRRIKLEAEMAPGEQPLFPTGSDDAMAAQLLLPPSHPEMLGRLGRYEVERLIGSGGMGIVFKAYDTELHRAVAIKMLAPQLAGSETARRRFAREARSAAAIVHEHVVPIHNVETEQVNPYLVMQYIAGDSLQVKIDQEGPLELREILRIGMQVAAGLAAAHAQGLIHRDVKPSNILLDENVSRALLTDFGLAHAEDDACLTRTGFQPGTPNYMSPEQIRGESLDVRSDQFGLGCVLYAMCTKHPPFQSENGFAVLRNVTDAVPRSIIDANSAIPNWLEKIVMRLLSKSPSDRYRSAHEVSALLEQCLAHVCDPMHHSLPNTIDVLPPSKSVRTVTLRRIFSCCALLVLLPGILPVLHWLRDALPSNVAQSPHSPTADSQVIVSQKSRTEKVENLGDLVTQIKRYEELYYPFRFTALSTFRVSADLPDEKRIRYPWADGRLHQRKNEYAQAKYGEWLQREQSLIDGKLGPRHSTYYSSDQEVQINEHPDGSEPQVHFLTDNLKRPLLYVPPLDAIFARGFSPFSEAKLSEVMAGNPDEFQLSWDGDDAVLNFSRDSAPDSFAFNIKTWFSRKHAWHPVKMQSLVGNGPNSMFSEWEATKLDLIDMQWRIQEGVIRYFDPSDADNSQRELTYTWSFQILDAAYGADVGSQSFEYNIPPNAAIYRDGKRLTVLSSDLPRSIKVRVLDMLDQPIQNAKIQFRQAESSALLDEQMSNEDGWAETGLGLGEVLVSVSAPTYRPLSWISGSGSAETSVRLLPQTKGIITDRALVPMAEMIVVEKPVQFRADGIAITPNIVSSELNTNSDLNGNFVLKTEGPFRISGVGQKFPLIAYDQTSKNIAIESLSLDDLSRPLKIVALPACQVDGQFVVAGNRASERFDITIEVEDGNTVGVATPTAIYRDGETTVSFKLRLPLGNYHVKCSNQLGTHSALAHVKVLGQTTELTIPLEKLLPTRLGQLIGVAAPELNVKWRSGDETTLEQLRGQVVVIDFWADWCAPCIAQMPSLLKMRDRFKDSPVSWIAIHSSTESSVDNMSVTIANLCRDRWKMPFTFRAALDLNGGVEPTSKSYAVEMWPTTIVINTDGTVYGPVEKEELTEVIERLLMPGEATSLE